MSKNKQNNTAPPKGHGPMKVQEKPKDFIGAIKKLLKSLKDYKALIILAVVLAAFSSILSLVSPNKLSD